MKTFVNQARQGDVLLRRVEKLPEGIELVPVAEKDKKDRIVISHSESGHNHVLLEDCEVFEVKNDPFKLYLVADNTKKNEDGITLFHDKPNDPNQHEALKIPPGIFEITRQKEKVDDRYRLAQD